MIRDLVGTSLILTGNPNPTLTLGFRELNHELPFTRCPRLSRFPVPINSSAAACFSPSENSSARDRDRAARGDRTARRSQISEALQINPIFVLRCEYCSITARAKRSIDISIAIAAHQFTVITVQLQSFLRRPREATLGPVKEARVTLQNSRCLTLSNSPRVRDSDPRTHPDMGWMLFTNDHLRPLTP